MTKKLSIKDMAIIAIFTAILCVLAPLSLPIGPVPISLTTLVIYFMLYILGAWKGTVSVLLYILIGLVGLPVFSGYSSGPAKLFGPTGGYIVGFIPLAIIAGLFISKYLNKWYLCFAGMILGTIVCYALGTIWLAYEMKLAMKAALMTGVVPFIPVDLIKMVLAMILAPLLRKALVKAHLL